MIFKKACCVFVGFLLLAILFTISASAARTGEFETYNVEFKALVPDDFTEPVKIALTHQTENYVLEYYLYNENNYFSNAPVHPGEYDVAVSVGNSDEKAYSFIYDKTLLIEPSNLAVPFQIIIDDGSLVGDVAESNITDLDENDISEITLEKDNNNSEFIQNESKNIKGSWKSLLVSLCISVLLLVVVVIGLVLWDKRR